MFVGLEDHCQHYMHLSLFRMMHRFISTGLTDTQYISSCKAANIGNVEEKYISTGTLVTC